MHIAREMVISVMVGFFVALVAALAGARLIIVLVVGIVICFVFLAVMEWWNRKHGVRSEEERFYRRLIRLIDRLYLSSPHREERYRTGAPSSLGLNIDIADSLMLRRKLRHRVVTRYRWPITPLLVRRLRKTIRGLGDHGVRVDVYLKGFLYRDLLREDVAEVASQLSRLSGDLPSGARAAKLSLDVTD